MKGDWSLADFARRIIAQSVFQWSYVKYFAINGTAKNAIQWRNVESVTIHIAEDAWKNVGDLHATSNFARTVFLREDHATTVAILFAGTVAIFAIVTVATGSIVRIVAATAMNQQSYAMSVHE